MRQQLIKATAALLIAAVTGPALADNKDLLSQHPNIAAADNAAQQAIARMHDAQHANGYDMHGHASRAIELLEQSRAEMRAAAADAAH